MHIKTIQSCSVAEQVILCWVKTRICYNLIWAKFIIFIWDSNFLVLILEYVISGQSMRLSRNFWLYEFTRSQTALRNGIDNTPSPEAVEELRTLVLNILQPLREMVGRPININSGFRSDALNTTINGSKNSQHRLGQAADIECFGLSNAALARMVFDHFQYDQLILEFHNPVHGPNSGWVHVSHKKDGGNRQSSLRALRNTQGSTKYHSLDW